VLVAIYAMRKRLIFGIVSVVVSWSALGFWLVDALLTTHYEVVQYGIICKSAVLSGLFALAVFSQSYIVAKRCRRLAEERFDVHGAFYFSANIVAALLPSLFISDQVQLSAWTLQTFINYLLFLKEETTARRVVSYLGLLLTTCALGRYTLLPSFGQTFELVTYTLIASMYLIDFFTANNNDGIRSGRLPRVFAHAANFLVYAVVFQLSSQLITFGLGLAGIVMLAAGFSLPSRLYRIWGLTGLVALCTRLVFVDLASANSVARIMSFIAAGLVLLAGSYAYTRFSERNAACS